MAEADVCCELCGNNNFNALGAIKVDVTIKNMSNKNTMSVIDDILKLGFTLVLRFNAITD